MKRYSSLLALLMLAGCANPGTQVPAATSNDAAPAGNGPQAYKALNADVTDIVVRYKEGHVRAMSHDKPVRKLAMDRTEVIEASSAEEREAILAKLRQDPAVEFAEPDFKMRAFYTPNDPSWSKQWDMTKIAMPAAWDITKGSADMVAAVVDTGVDYNHPELQGRVIKGRDFANNDNDPMDDQAHGTHVAGTIAAAAGNGVGVAGVAPNVKILAVKVLGGDGSGNLSSIIDGITYAANNGAKVINLSLGGPQQSSALKTAIDNAVAKGVVVVAAAGNDSSQTPNYPAAYPNVVSVGSSDQNDRKSSFSTYGSTIDIVAPGSSILSTTPNNRYQTMDGTSMASPHVAGAAALVRSLHPDWSVDQVRKALETTGDAVSGFESSPSAKRMNVLKALQYGGGGTAPAPTPAPAEPTPAEPTPAPTTYTR